MNDLRQDMDPLYKQEMRLFGRTLAEHANRHLQHTDWLQDFASYEEFEKAFDAELDEMFEGSLTIDK